MTYDFVTFGITGFVYMENLAETRCDFGSIQFILRLDPDQTQLAGSGRQARLLPRMEGPESWVHLTLTGTSTDVPPVALIVPPPNKPRARLTLNFILTPRWQYLSRKVQSSQNDC